MGLHNQAHYPGRRSSVQPEPTSHTTSSKDHQDLDRILLIRCYFCTLAGPASRARSFRGAWICSDCYSTPEAREVLGLTGVPHRPEEVQ
jgi:hypothetical protein